MSNHESVKSRSAIGSNSSMSVSPAIQREATTGADHATSDPMPSLTRAASEAARPLDAPVRSRLENYLGQDFSHVRVHSGEASATAAGRIGARAYTLGRDVHLGREVGSMPAPDRSRLLAHEAVHTVQQGATTVTPRRGLAVSDPGDGAEREAERIAESVSAPAGSRSLAMIDRIGARHGGIARSVAPHLQRDLNGTHPVTGGEFKMDMKKNSNPGGTNGMTGTIRFTASKAAPDSTNIKLLQVVRDEDLSTGKDYVWTGAEANRNKLMTAEDPANGVQGGYFVDHSAAMASPRTAKGDAAVSPYYRDYWPNAANSQDGSKSGATVVESSLWDSPGSGGKRRFTFETIAKATDNGHVYGTVMWGFTISDPAKGVVDHEVEVGRNVTLRNSDKALEKFNEFYRNPGASTAP
jgi:hypothetical protein